MYPTSCDNKTTVVESNTLIMFLCLRAWVTSKEGGQ